MIKKERFTKRISIALSERQLILMCQRGIRAENVRAFIENYDVGTKDKKIWIKSGEWQKLKEILFKVPSLVLIGVPGAGKSFLVSELVKNDREHTYIILDSHACYTFLPSIHQISPKLTESSVLEMNKMDEAAGLNFKMYKSLIQYDTFPKNFCLVVDEALRYEDHGIDKMLAESRKFVRVLAIAQRSLKGVDFIPEVHVENYNKINI